MNTVIPFIESWAQVVEGWFWPMLWQTSLLIAFLCVIDILLRQRLCASIRYGLWLLVLVKIVLPPSLAFPSGAGWWLRSSASVSASPQPTATGFTVRYGEFTSRPTPVQSAAPPQPAFSVSSRALLVLGAVAVSLALFGWSLRRWVQFAKLAGRPAPLPEEMRRLVAGLVEPSVLGRFRIAVTDSAVSPAVYGLMRPVIVIPRALLSRFSQAELRAVLLHEIIHYQRCDVWVNLAQTALQIGFWWHPLLWLANARIRSLREEAVDDAVMACLRSDAETYAPTLLQVARLTLRRPAAVLGLVGILESPSPLRRRIERLIDYVPPRQKGLGLLSVSFIVVFGALALPMGPRLEQPQLEQNRAPGLAVPVAEIVSNSPPVAQTPDATSPANGTRLHVRSFNLDLRAVETNLDALSPTTNGSATVAVRLRGFLSSAGFKMEAPNAMYVGADGRLLIRAPQQDLDAIGAIIAELMKRPPQIAIKVQVFEAPFSEARAFWASLGQTNKPRAVAFLDKDKGSTCSSALAGVPGATVHEGIVTTLSGRQAQLQWVENVTVVSSGPSSSSSPPWITNALAVGPTVDIVAHEGHGTNVQVSASVSQTEFVGYDEPEQFVPSTPIGTTMAVLPLPHFRVREIERVAAVCRDGDTLVLGGAAEFDRIIRRTTETKSTPSRTPSGRDLIVFITPTIVDAAGNPVNAK